MSNNVEGMIKFDKEKALAGEPVVTISRKAVKNLCYHPDGRTYPWSGYVEGLGVLTWDDCGKHNDHALALPCDLVMKPELVTWYAVVGISKNNHDVHKSSKTKDGKVVFLRTRNKQTAQEYIDSMYPHLELIEVKGKKLFNVKDIK